MDLGTFTSGTTIRHDSSSIISEPHISPEQHACLGLFGKVQELLQSSPSDDAAHQSLDELFGTLRDCKQSTSSDVWAGLVRTFRKHPLMELLHRDPFTFRAYSKPRGYAGDAVMMDYIYGREELWPMPETDAIGRHVFNYTTQAPASEGVRSRRAHIAAFIDRLTQERRRPHILSIACGHLREVNLSAAIRRRKTGRLVALDADAASLTEVQRAYGVYGVETVAASFREMLQVHRKTGDFDLVYSTGLFDYLNQRTARRLVTSMFKMLRPGGVVLVANFLPAVRDIGYMETFMDWNLIYRSRGDMMDLTMDIPEDDIREVTVLSEEFRNIVFLQVTKN
ncbi:MAG: class I SAM-dependent methyltransferase [Pirellulaceae bacterium]|nr:class I SAM-dependent methyltransferase [Pirellulaceae bacterium]